MGQRQEVVVSSGRVEKSPHEQEISFFAKEVLRSPSGSLLELSAEHLANILEKDTLNIEQEKTAFEVLISWIQHDPDTRMQHLVDLLKKVSSSKSMSLLGLMKSTNSRAAKSLDCYCIL
ncbi:kelch-like protein 10 [Silurus meridionalis]|nr:kelch-like protein 10 [Silurus meridionalis]